MTINETLKELREQRLENFKDIDFASYENDGKYRASVQVRWKEKIKAAFDKESSVVSSIVSIWKMGTQGDKQTEMAIPDPNFKARAQLLTAAGVSIPRLFHLAEQAGYLGRGTMGYHLGTAKSAVNLLGSILTLASEPYFSE